MMLWRIGDRVTLKNSTYTVDGVKVRRRNHDLPAPGASGTIIQLGENVSRVKVEWDNDHHIVRWVDYSCITVAPTEKEMKEVYKSLGVEP